MSQTTSVERESLILIHAPTGRDARLLEDVLHRATLHSQVCSSVNGLCDEVEHGAGTLFIAEEALVPSAIEMLSAVLQKQGPWSDLPLLVLTARGGPTPAVRERLARLEPLGEITLLERPLRSDTLVSAVRSALRARGRQYEVRRRDAELQLVTDNVPVLISYIDRGQIYRRVNQTYFEWFGRPTEEVVGSSIKNVMGEPHYSNAQAYIARALDGERVSFESQFWDRNQQLRDVSVSYAPDIGLDGRVRGFVSLVQDITDRKRAERTLRASGARLQFLGELEEATRTLTAPESVMAIIARMTAEQLKASGCFYADVECDSETLTVQLNYAAEGSGPSLGTYRLSSFGPRFAADMKSGKSSVIRNVKTEMVSDEGAGMFLAMGVMAFICCSLVKDGKLIAMMGVSQTAARQWTEAEEELFETVVERSWAYIERSRAQSELRKSEQQFRTLADTIPNLAWMAYAGGDIFWYNQRWYDYTGTEPEDMEGWGWQSVHDPDYLPKVLENWNTSLSNGTPFEMVFPLKGADGIFRLFLTRVAPVCDNFGTVVRWFGTNTDIDEQKRAEEALRRANGELEEFAYVASHDLQEPLRMVNVYTQLLLKRLGTQASPQLQEYADFVSTGVRRMEALIRDLLTYSRTTHHDEDEITCRADLTAALRHAIASVDARVQENHAEVTFDELPVVAGDEGQLSHVFQNLLSNALKYRKTEETPQIHIGAERQNGQWIVRIQDNGIGFHQDHAERIFGLFKRLHRDEEYPGTGLGLAICKRIVERYRGRIWAESKAGVGSTFYIALPEGRNA